ncbi:MAG: transporter [Rikenellaceae bacterium]|nr:transporter [Rikenellaceae bacterium]
MTTLVYSAAAFGQHPTDRAITSRLEIYDTESGTRIVFKEYPYLIEAPNWTMDGKALVYNSEGKIFRVEITDPAIDVQIPTGDVERCNNDHVLSVDGTGLAISSSSPKEGGWLSRIYVLPLAGGTPRLVTPEGPSFLHGWSPDGSTLAYTAQRGGGGYFNIYAIAADGSAPEVRLTTTDALDDGPEYSRDGRHIWFNSTRTGLMQVWRMNPDGSEQTQITTDETRNSWFPHISPDGKTVVYIAYAKGDVAPGDHPAGKNVELRLMTLVDCGKCGKGCDCGEDCQCGEWSEPATIVKLFGGQGTINVNSWSPDSRRFAFVSYEYGPKKTRD